MQEQIETITINNVEYVKKTDLPQMAEQMDGLDFVIVRTYSAGVHAGYLEKRGGKEVTLRRSIWIWHWEGAAAISQLAVDGTKKPDGCSFTCEVDEVTLTEAIQIIPCTEKARISIQGVKKWVV